MSSITSIITGLGLGGKVLAEALSTGYTIAVRTSPFSELTQGAFRTMVILLSILPFTYYLPNVLSSTLSLSWIFIGLINILHVWSSFRAFKILPSGPAISIYFAYPVFAVILSYLILGRQISWYSGLGIVLAFSGVLYMNQDHTNESGNENGELTMNTEGVLWALTSGLTEAIMYVFIIAGGSIFNNHLVVMTALYFWSGILGILYLLYQQCFSTSGTCSGVIAPETKGEPPAFSWSGLGMVGINLLLGVGGMTLQHGSARVIPTGTYATLSYIGVFFAYIYGILMGDRIRIRDLIGSTMILAGSLFGGIV